MFSDYIDNALIQEIMDSSVLFIVGIAVYCFVYGGSVKNRYKDLSKAVKIMQEHIRPVERIIMEQAHSRYLRKTFSCRSLSWRTSDYNGNTCCGF